MKALAGIYNVDRVRPYPEALVISLVVPHRGAQDHDVSKDLAVEPSSRSGMKTVFPQPVCPTIAAWVLLGRISVC